MQPTALARPKQISPPQQANDKFQAGSQASSLRTHVLLAACKNDELAQEIETPETSEPGSCGLFTWALIQAMRECDLVTTSYSGLMRSVQNRATRILVGQARKYQGVKLQTPQCEGQKQDRLVFRTQYGLTKGMIQLEHDPFNKAFRIKAGTASGIQEGAQLDVYDNDAENKSGAITQLVVTNANPTTALLRFREGDQVVDIPEDAYVVVTKYAGYSIRILVDDRLEQDQVWQEVREKVNLQRIDVTWCKPGEQSDLVLVPTDKGIEVQRTDPSLIQLRPRSIVLGNELSANEIARRLAAIANFHFHLQRQNPKSSIKGQFNMKLIELICTHSYSWGGKEYAPRSLELNDLFGDCLSTGKVAELEATREHRFGMQLSNRSNWPLFAWVLYFDFEDYSINFLYSPPGRATNPPLLNNGRPLAVGYGDSGVEPLRVENSGYSTRETGVFMLLVSHKWIDISHMDQPSIFEPVMEGEIRDGMGQFVQPDSNAWDVVTVGVSIDQTDRR
ncbi:ICE-like protease (caspase) p20 domain protein [Ceratobasidium sp. AG-Ba]|nr:ICE-like protease (caspase) p20 domain protein [Ceratobasidium sp. AG-Ba]QRW13606.1 ICE-like protease (caspase) p20 domain protein [Ceratobasidium sp. AG-Ba]